MALLNRKVDYALLILAFLYHRQEGGSARAIANQFGLSQAFVANILKRLCHKEWVVSQRGTKGGYVLHKPARDIHLLELLDALDEPFHLAECCQELPAASCTVFGICPIKGPVTAVHRRLRDMLASITLAELVEATERAEELPVALDVSRCQRV
jgi:Rrf2 family protein